MRIVVRGTNWIGDAVMTIPALRQVRRIFPHAHIALHTRSWAKGIFCDADFLDEIITFDPTGTALRNAMEQGRILRKQAFDQAILFTNSFESALAAKLGRIPRRFGYSHDARGMLLTDPVAVPEWKSKRHEVFYYLNLVATVEKTLLSSETVTDHKAKIDIPVSEWRRTQARSMLEEFGADISRLTVALGVGSTNSRAKRWLPENYARLNDLLQREFGANVILVGSADEKVVSESVFAMAEKKPIVLTGRTKLDEAVAVLSEIDLMVSNDMGLAHIASAVGTKTLVIFGPTDPETTAPFSSRARIIRKEVECSPCMLRDCPIDHRCMTRISVDEVFENVKAALTQEAKNYSLAT
jgi:heptosyltransferase II